MRRATKLKTQQFVKEALRILDYEVVSQKLTRVNLSNIGMKKIVCVTTFKKPGQGARNMIIVSNSKVEAEKGGTGKRRLLEYYINLIPSVVSAHYNNPEVKSMLIDHNSGGNNLSGINPDNS